MTNGPERLLYEPDPVRDPEISPGSSRNATTTPGNPPHTPAGVTETAATRQPPTSDFHAIPDPSTNRILFIGSISDQTKIEALIKAAHVKQP